MARVLVAIAAQEGTPSEVYRTPKTPFVATLMGECNRLERALEASTASCGRLHVRPARGHAARGPSRRLAGGLALAFVRPEHVAMGPVGSLRGRENVLQGTVLRQVYRGSTVAVRVAVDQGFEIRATLVPDADGSHQGRLGARVEVAIPPASLVVLARA